MEQPKKLKRVIHIPRRFVSTEWGGTETTILQLSRCLLKRGIVSDIFTSKALSNTKEEKIAGVRVKRFSYFYPFFKLGRAANHQMDLKGGNLFSFALLWQLLFTRNLDLIHLHTGKRLGGIARTVAKLRGIPYVVTLHGGVFDVPEGEQRKMVQPGESAGLEWGKALGALVGARRVLEDADALICVGENEAQAARRAMPEKRIHTLPNGVDCKAFASGDRARFRRLHGIAEDEKVILCLSRIDYQKNQLALIEALPRILAVEPKTKLLLVGPITVPAYQASLAESIKTLDLADKIIQLPGIAFGDKRLFDAYQASDVFNLPSLHEPFGIVILEAWAAGLPVVASRVGGIPDFTCHGEDALLIDPNSSAELAAANIKLLQDEAYAKRLAAQGRSKAKDKYDWSVICKDLLACYQQVTTKSQPNRLTYENLAR